MQQGSGGGRELKWTLNAMEDGTNGGNPGGKVRAGTNNKMEACRVTIAYPCPLQKSSAA